MISYLEGGVELLYPFSFFAFLSDVIFVYVARPVVQELSFTGEIDLQTIQCI